MDMDYSTLSTNYLKGKGRDFFLACRNFYVHNRICGE